MLYKNKNRFRIKVENHPFARKDGTVLRSRLVAEKVLGKYLPKESIVHHINENVSNDSNDNLVICENRAYHILLHHRQKALRECGDANFKKCVYCHQYDDPRNLTYNESCRHFYHKTCDVIKTQNYRIRKKERTLNGALKNNGG